MIAGAATVEPASADDALSRLDATSAINAMRRGEMRAENYARALLSRADKLKVLNAFRVIDADAVLEAARTADKARDSGRDLGPLHGLPIPIKDSIDTRSLPTSDGTRALRNFRPKGDATIVRSLRSQGAIVMGKTNLHEISLGYTSNNEIFGPVHNPYYNQSYIPGGSSGGSAAAVAARLAPLALGEDTLGSIRVPASCCGIVGLRPTLGRYPSDGVMPLASNKFDQVGSLARSIQDLLLFDGAIVGEAAPVKSASLKGTRIGIAPAYHLIDLDPQVETLFSQSLHKLRDAGMVVVEAELPKEAQEAPRIALTIMAYEMAASISGFLKEQDVGITFDQLFAEAGIGTQHVVKALALPPNRPTDDIYKMMLTKRDELRSAMARYYKNYSIVALAFPTIPCLPPKIGEDMQVTIGGRKGPLPVAMSHNVSLGSCCSLASLVLPAGLATDRLPVGIEFAAPSGKDRYLLTLGLSLKETLGSLPPPELA
jgi:mandelamide amidase